MNQRLTIGKVAHQSGLSVPSIRFYEAQGIIPAPDVPAGLTVAECDRCLLMDGESGERGYCTCSSPQQVIPMESVVGDMMREPYAPEVIERLMCEVGKRPGGAPTIEEIVGSVTSLQRETDSLVVDFDPTAAEMVRAVSRRGPGRTRRPGLPPAVVTATICSGRVRASASVLPAADGETSAAPCGIPPAYPTPPDLQKRGSHPHPITPLTGLIPWCTLVAAYRSTRTAHGVTA